jgi:hypothetical protein
MLTLIVIALYAVAGAVFAAVVVLREGPKGLAHAAVVWVFWPFLAPAVLGASEPGDSLARAIVAVERELAGAEWKKERQAVEGLARSLRARRARLAEVSATRTTALPKAREALEALEGRLMGELQAGEALLEDLAAQLTLVRLGATAGGRVSVDQVHVEALLGQLDALVRESADAPPS